MDLELALPERRPQDQASSILRAGVIGAGQMGAGIAGTLARASISTTMVDVNQAVLDAGLKRAHLIAARGASPAPPDLHASPDLKSLARCDVVIEAVTEDDALKAAIFASLAGVLGPSAILASNTSTIPITRLARSWPHPARFAGMHFFHPAQRMELVEVIRGEHTSDETITMLAALARRLGKTPIVVGDGPGFLTTRVLFPYLSQALQLLREGAGMDAIDAAATTFGMASGPIAVLDFVGLDTALSISRVMAEGFPERASANPLLVDLVERGRLGQKSGAGFRKFEPAAPRGSPDPALDPILRPHRLDREPPTDEEITDRLFLSMLLEAIRALDEGIVRDAVDIDLGVVLGLGFPSSRGGILAWCDAEGASAILDRSRRFESLGPAFHPPATLARMALTKTSFHARTPPVAAAARPPGPIT